jgi:aldose 1-epimerase
MNFDTNQVVPSVFSRIQEGNTRRLRTVLFENDLARVQVDLEQGARLSSLCIDGLEVLVDQGEDPLRWGCYPMAPWAGRLCEGRFEYEGETFQMPLTLPPHAIHGTVHQRRWEREGPDRVCVDLGEDWPFSGRAVQIFRLQESGLRLRLEIHSDRDAFPAVLGWHPWFRRQLSKGEPAELSFSAQAMYARDEQHIPTGERIAVSDGPWDDCFVGVSAAPEIHWPGALRLRLLSKVSHWVVYDEPTHAICVEPMTAPPNGLNLLPEQVSPGCPLVAEFEIRWGAETTRVRSK